MSSVWTLATISTQIITIPSATASAETIAQGHLLPWDSKFLGDVSQPGVSIVTLDDQHLVQDGGKNRRLTKVQLWCGPQGPISMIPWYSESDDLSIKGDARQWTWGKNPPEGTYKELVVNHDNEYFRMTKVQSCGKPGRRRICFFYIQKWNSFTRRYTSVRCGGQDQDDLVQDVVTFTGSSEVGNRALGWFSGTFSQHGITGMKTHWSDLAKF